MLFYWMIYALRNRVYWLITLQLEDTFPLVPWHV